MYGEARRLDPDALAGNTGPADASRLLGRYEDALIEYDLLIEAGATSETYSRRGKTCRRLERYDEALADLDHALDLDASNIGALHCRAETYRLTGLLDEALADYERAIERSLFD
jgi:tetratricopeptide (TPR) repeat protein